MRPIDADALKDYIDAQEGRPFIGCTVGQALKIMTDEQPTIHPEPHWIPVTKRLPEESGLYQVTDMQGNVVRYVFNANDSSVEYWRRCVKAWMPLPEPYKGVNV